MRGAFEHHGDLRDALAQALAGTQIERHAGPTAGVDVQADRGIGLGGGFGIDALLVQVADHLVRSLPSGGVLASRGVRGQILGQAHGGEHLGLLGGQIGGGEGDGLLHGGQRHKLQQMVLDDVACGADAVVVSGAPGHADVLGHGDLHMVDVIVVPDRLVHGVRETQRQHVLHGLLAKIMVDAEHARRVEHFGDHAIELLGAGQVMTERLFDDHTTPSALVAFRQTTVGQLTGHLRERARRHRHVERVIAARATVAVKLGDRVGQTLERFRIIERALYETDTGRKLLPSRFLERRTAMRLHVLLDEVLEMVLGPVAACEACQTEAWRQQATVGQIVDGGEQLLTGQIAGHAENHDAAWACDAGKSQIARVAQRIRPCVGRVGCG